MKSESTLFSPRYRCEMEVECNPKGTLMYIYVNLSISPDIGLYLKVTTPNFVQTEAQIKFKITTALNKQIKPVKQHKNITRIEIFHEFF